MNAIRVQKRGGGTTRYAIHLLVDPGRTYCGLKPEELQVVEELELGDDENPRADVACLGCIRARDRVKYTRTKPTEQIAKITAEPRAGRVRRVGPLNHGTRSRGRQGFYR